jgi:glycosyltransferase involved in cell wall biosynthesis
MGERVVNEYRRQLDVSLVCVNYHTYPLLQRFLDSVKEYPPSVSYEVLVIDVESLSEIENIDLHGARLIRKKENVGYARACNEGIVETTGKVVALLNADTEFVNTTCVDRLFNFLMEDEKRGIAGPLQYSHDGLITHGGIMGTHAKPQHRGWRSRNIKAFRDDQRAVTVSGSAFFIKRSLCEYLTECPIFLEQFPLALSCFPTLPHMFEETLVAYHAHGHGYEVWYLGAEGCEMIHRWHQSSPVGGKYATDGFRIGQQAFREFCASHGLDHD